MRAEFNQFEFRENQKRNKTSLRVATFVYRHSINLALQLQPAGTSSQLYRVQITQFGLSPFLKALFLFVYTLPSGCPTTIHYTCDINAQLKRTNGALYPLYISIYRSGRIPYGTTSTNSIKNPDTQMFMQIIH